MRGKRENGWKWTHNASLDAFASLEGAVVVKVCLSAFEC